jgi:hypothetical protein
LRFYESLHTLCLLIRKCVHLMVNADSKK